MHVQWYVCGDAPPVSQVIYTHPAACFLNEALCANVGMPQVNAKFGYTEDMLITIGDDVNSCRRYLKQDESGDWSYSAADVIDHLLAVYEASGKTLTNMSKARPLCQFRTFP